MEHSTADVRFDSKPILVTTVSTATVTPPSQELTIDGVIAQAHVIAKGANENERKKLIDGLRDLAISLENSQDSAQRLLYSQYPLMALRLGCDLNLFNILKDAGHPLSTDELAVSTGMTPSLMGRFLRYMSSHRIIKEVGPDSFTANNVTETFTIPGVVGGVYHYFGYMSPGVQGLPDFLKKRGYQRNIDSAFDCPLMKGWGSDLPTFLHYQTQPELFEHFNRFMVAQRLGMPTWLDAYPYKAAAEGIAPERPFFVDVGGGVGHQCVALREALPQMPNAIVLQDIPATLAQHINHPGVEVQVQDFFTPQRIKNARFYYMRNILHDYPEDRSLEILGHLRDAMSADSSILIDYMCLPTSNVHWQATALDITMMIALSAIERTEAQWYDLIPKAGLKITKIYKYTESLGDSIIECVLA